MAEGDLLTEDYQIEWRGVVLGNGTVYRLRTLEGWVDLPSHRVGLEPRSGRHGSYPTQLLAEHRTVIAELLIGGLPDDFKAYVKELRRVTSNSENVDEQPLVITWDGLTQQVMARCTRRSIPAEYSHYPLGRAIAVLEWVASDPRQLELPNETTSTALAASSGGLEFELEFPLDFGLGSVGGTMTMSNDGNVDAWPIFHMIGPLTAPVIYDTNNGRSLKFKDSTIVPDGETWEIDTNARTVTLLGTATGRNNELLIRQWISIPPGESHDITFTSTTYDAAARLHAIWHHTDM